MPCCGSSSGPGCCSASTPTEPLLSLSAPAPAPAGAGRPSEGVADAIRSDISRRRFLGACCATGFGIVASGSLASVLSACGSGSSSTAGTIRVGHLPAGCIQHLLLASKRGLFKKAGLDVQLQQFDGPPPNLQALVGGSIDISHNPWTTVISAYDKGQKNLRIIGGSGKGGIELVARAGSVKSVPELAVAKDTGLKVGTLRLDTLELVTYGTMKKAGVSYSNYAMKFFPSMVGMGEALIKKSVDVASLAQPYGATVVDQAHGSYLEDSNQVWGPDASDCVVHTTSAYLEKNKTKLETYLHVLQDAARQRDADFEKALTELQPIYQVPRPILASGLERQTPQPVLDAKGLQSLHNGTGYLIELTYLERDVVSDIFDPSVQSGAHLAAA
jgi:NitT/TauT family transport system substrate-binding protein